VTARLLNVPPSHIRVTVPAVGGGFGLKFDCALEPFAALLARAAERPVRLVNSRQEEMLDRMAALRAAKPSKRRMAGTRLYGRATAVGTWFVFVGPSAATVNLNADGSATPRRVLRSDPAR
jgi:CO/xanthine dehydrogenase Mo-binding subunit